MDVHIRNVRFMKPFYVYLLRCADGSYYCGHTDNLDMRMQQHEAGNVGYTSTRKPVVLVWQSEFERREEAIASEQQIKGWSRAKKEALIAGDWDRISELAKSQGDAENDLARDRLALRQAQGERLVAGAEAQGGQR